MKQITPKIQSPQSPKSFARLASCAALTITTALLASCGPPAFVPGQSLSQQMAPGAFSVSPKVDILLVQDDTGSSKPIFGQISNQLKGFLGNLQSQGWDYHLATIPLTHQRTLNQVQASKFDANWGSQWIPPYPGALLSGIASITQAAFRFPDNYTDFLTGDKVTSTGGGDEPGLNNVRRMLLDSSMTSTGFLRDDAMLAVVLLSTGDDTSERNYCDGAYRSNGTGGAASCDLIPLAYNGTHPSIVCGQPGANPQPYCNNRDSSLAVYKNFFANFKGPNTTTLTRFYPVVAAQRMLNDGCQGANSFIGTRYQDLANYLGSRTFDICSTPIPEALTGIAANLATVELKFYTHYLFMAQEPNPASIHVYRNPGGDESQRVELQGWTFVGQISNQYTTSVDSPYAVPTLNRGSGWAVQLHGSDILGGSDTATVEFTQAGLQSSGG